MKEMAYKVKCTREQFSNIYLWVKIKNLFFEILDFLDLPRFFRFDKFFEFFSWVSTFGSAPPPELPW